ncbi:uncharacterized protein G2W53_040895 [Senna tora]|uniref:Uncharacterized protein n=1 Tax=Senna tora TaxID=362788 RepID=A0A834W2F1_9FABA|nr:uncharacterized protein G2W53_040895 [Senna tora]
MEQGLAMFQQILRMVKNPSLAIVPIEEASLAQTLETIIATTELIKDHLWGIMLNTRMKRDNLGEGTSHIITRLSFGTLELLRREGNKKRRSYDLSKVPTTPNEGLGSN